MTEKTTTRHDEMMDLFVNKYSKKFDKALSALSGDEEAIKDISGAKEDNKEDTDNQ